MLIENFVSRLALSASVAALTAAPAFAQDAAPVDNARYDEIVVTAQKREQNLNDVGLTITAISSDALLKQGISSVDDLARVVPGFDAATTPIGSPVYSLRGVGFYDTTLAATPAVTIYVDEIPLAYPVMAAGASLDLQRVEVLKGPQGTLFGQNSTGGAINYIAAKPTDSFEAGLNASVARFGLIELDGFVSGPLTETLSARVAVAAQQGGAWQRSYTRDDSLGDRNFLNGRLLLNWEPSSSARFTFGLSGWKDKSEMQAGQYVQFRPLLPAAVLPELRDYPLAPDSIRAADWSPGEWRRDNSMFQVWARADVDIGTATLTSLTSYSQYDRDERVDSDGIALRIVDRVASGKIKVFNQELRIAGDASQDLRWILGVNYSADKTSDFNLSDFSDASAAFATGRYAKNITFFSRQKFRSLGAFANLEYDLAPSVTIKAGGRYTDTKRDYVGCSRDSGDGLTAAGFGGLWSTLSGHPVPIAPGGCITLVDPVNFVPGVVEDTLKEDNFAWRAGIDWRASNDLLLYANISKGYKAGAYPTASATTVAQYTPVPQESVLAYEGGFKAELLDRAVNVTGAIYYYDYKGKQILGRIPVPVFRSLDALVSVPKSSVFGQEITLNIRPVEGLAFETSVVHSKATIDKYSGYTDLAVLTVFDDTEMPFAPKWEVTSRLDYEWNVSSRIDAFVGANLRYRGSTFAYPGEDTTFRIDDYTTLDLRAGITSPDKGWTFSLWGRNVTNSPYYNNIQRQVDTVVRFMAKPATYGATLSLRFD